jgi:hypothetical protein
MMINRIFMFLAMKIRMPAGCLNLENKERTETRVLEPKEREGAEGDCF